MVVGREEWESVTQELESLSDSHLALRALIDTHLEFEGETGREDAPTHEDAVVQTGARYKAVSQQVEQLTTRVAELEAENERRRRLLVERAEYSERRVDWLRAHRRRLTARLERAERELRLSRHVSDGSADNAKRLMRERDEARAELERVKAERDDLERLLDEVDNVCGVGANTDWLETVAGVKQLRSQLSAQSAVVEPILELARVFPPGRGREFSGYDPGTLVRAALDAADALPSAGSAEDRRCRLCGGSGRHPTSGGDCKPCDGSGLAKASAGSSRKRAGGESEPAECRSCDGEGWVIPRSQFDDGVRCRDCRGTGIAPATEEPAPKQGEAPVWERHHYSILRDREQLAICETRDQAEAVVETVKADLRNAPAGVPVERVEHLEQAAKLLYEVDENLRDFEDCNGSFYDAWSTWVHAERLRRARRGEPESEEST